MGRPSEGPPAAAAPRSHRQQQRKGNKQPHAPPTRARRGWRVPWRGAVVALLAGGAAVGVSLVAWSILYVSGAALAAAVAGESHPGTPLEGWRYARAKLLEGLPLLPAAWTRLRRRRIAPALQAAADAGVAIFLVQALDKLLQCGMAAAIFWRRARRANRAHPAAQQQRTRPRQTPRVLVQVPMCNEREVYAQSIAAACCLEWPGESLLVQVLDDSSCKDVQHLIQDEVAAWAARGAPIVYHARTVKGGYKAGNLQAGLAAAAGMCFEFVAIFDADFMPRPDFLRTMMPHFEGRPDRALVQARWAFVNTSQNLLTRFQAINFAYHFMVEQQVGSSLCGFFGFNGTAGVWRTAAIEEAGGWDARTTVEDMDLAVRAHLCGYTFLYVNECEALCELPCTYRAYCKQQHRWNAGPVVLFFLCLPAILRSGRLGAARKAYVVAVFFVLRKLVLPTLAFLLFCLLLPTTIFIPEISVPVWAVFYLPTILSLLHTAPYPRAWPYLFPFLLFENVMTRTKCGAIWDGLVGVRSVKEWVVTKKTGARVAAPPAAAASAAAFHLVSGDAVSPTARALAAGAGLLHTLEDVLEAGLFPGDPTDDAADLVSTASPTARQVAHLMTGRAPRPSPAAASAVGEPGKAAPDGAPPAVAVRGGPSRQVSWADLALGAYLVVAAGWSVVVLDGRHAFFLAFQGGAFLAAGLDLVGDPS